MKLRAATAALLLAPTLALTLPFSARASSGDPKASPSPTPTLLDETLQLLHLKHSAQPKATPQVHKQIEVKLDIAPPDFKLSDTREIQVTISLINHSKKYLDLDFPTTQRIEVLVRDASGKVVNTWSEDQSFTNDPASVTVNPGERLVYTASVATREMTPGQHYTIEASFPQYPAYKIQQQVIPQK